MANYAYKAKNRVGEVVSGEMEAASESLVAEALIKTGVYPFSIEEKSEQIEVKSNKKFDLLLFTRQMYTLIRSGVPISRALKTMETSNESQEMRLMFKDIRTSLDNGYELYVALQKHPKKFNQFYINMVRVGEITGKLEEIFEELYNFLEFEQDVKSKAKSAIRYPIFVFSAISIVFVIMMIFVVPVFANLYKNFKAELPLPTKLLIGTSEFMTQYGILLLFVVGGLIYMFISYIKTEEGKFWWDRKKIRIPIVGKILKKIVLNRFTKSFSLSLKSGIPVVQSLNNVSQVIDNAYFEKHIDGIKESVERGNTLYSAMKNTGVFEPLVLEMIATGEESGELENMCDEVSYLYSKEVDYDLKALSSYIEPIMLFLLGGLILVLATGIFLPMWDFGSVVMGK